MTRSNRQLALLLQEVIRLVRSGRLSVRWIAVLVVVALAYLLLQPALERSLGVDLPGFSDLSREGSTQTADKAPAPSSREAPDATAIDRILGSSSREVFISPEGLRYTPGSVHGHRLKHLMAHTEDEPDRPGQHGVFDSKRPSEVIALVDKAYRQALSGESTRVKQEEDRTIYTVNLGRSIGYIGGESGNRRSRPVARHVRLVLEGRNFVTAFPYRP